MNAKDFCFKVFGFFFPNVCISCGRIIEEGEHFCEDCKLTLLDIDAASACPYCGIEKPDCDCAYHIYYFNNVASCFYNEGAAKNAVYRYKLSKKQHYAKTLSDIMVENVKEKFPGVEFDYVTAVPTSAGSFLKHGFDHSRLLAKNIGRSAKIPVKKGVIGCRPFVASQHTSGYKERFTNVRDKYFVKKHIKAENVLLVDDIKTTGATLDAVARALLYSGAKHVYCVTLLCGTIAT